MSILLSILLIVAIIVVFLLFLALITKGDYSIERDIVIDNPGVEVFNYVKLLRNQEEYSVWVMQDPTNRITYHGQDGTVGFVGKWQGEKQAGKGEQEIISLVDGKSTHVEIRFEKPFKNVGQTHMTIVSTDGTNTKLKWQMTGKNKFPFTLMNLVIDSLLGKAMQQSLFNVKHNLETK